MWNRNTIYIHGIRHNTCKRYWIKIYERQERKLHVAYNIQSAVDYDTKLICAINVTQNLTDPYELPNLVERAIRNINSKPKYISADTIYLNQISLSYLADKKIGGLIPNRKQTKEKIGKLNPNPCHKDHFEYDYELNVFNVQKINICTFLQNIMNHTKVQKN